MVNPYVVFWPVLCVYILMMGSECGWGLGEGPNFQFSRGP